MLTENQKRVLELHKSGKCLLEIANVMGIDSMTAARHLVNAESILALHQKYPHLTKLTNAQLNGLNRQKITEDALRDIATNNPEMLYTIKGIGQKGARKICEAFGVTPPAIASIVVEFAPNEIACLVRILKERGEDLRAPETVKNVLKKLSYAKEAEA